MLVLSRRKDESIIIGEGIVVTIVEVGRGRVRLGITAPSNVSIRREEVHCRIVQEGRQLDNSEFEVETSALLEATP